MFGTNTPNTKFTPLSPASPYKTDLESKSSKLHPQLIHHKQVVGKVHDLTPKVRHQVRPPKGNKRKAVVDFLAAHPVPDDSPLATDLLDEGVMTVRTQIL